MTTENTNPSIRCSVKSCAYHNGQAQTCTLREIKVGCCSTNVGSCDATECASFKLGCHGTDCGCGCH